MIVEEVKKQKKMVENVDNWLKTHHHRAQKWAHWVERLAVRVNERFKLNVGGYLLKTRLGNSKWAVMCPGSPKHVWVIEYEW
jgi:hypothetical protein